MLFVVQGEGELCIFYRVYQPQYFLKSGSVSLSESVSENNNNQSDAVNDSDAKQLSL